MTGNVRGVKFMLDVSDMDRGVAFYRDVVGLDVELASKEWSELRVGDAVIALHDGRSAAGTVRTGLSFTVTDLDGFVKRVAQNGGALLHGPFSPRPGLRLAELADPDGNCFMASEDQ